MARKGMRLAVGATVIAAGLITLATVSFRQNLVYYLSVGEFLDRHGDLPSRGYRVNGNVVAGSVVRATAGPGVTFTITDGRRTMPVAYTRELPDTFRDGTEVVIEGTADANGVFQARTLLAKCPSKYEKLGPEHPKDIRRGDSPAPSGTS